MTQLPVEQALQTARRHHSAGRLAEAEAIYRRILATQPDHAQTLHLLGVLTGQRGDLEGAVELIQKAIALAPSNAAFHGNLGKFLKDLDRGDQAAQHCRRAIALDPRIAESHNNLAYALGKNPATLDEAIAACQQAIRIKPGFAGAYHNLALALHHKGLRTEALAAARQAVLLDPGFAEAHHHLAQILQKAGQFQDALASYRRAIDLDPKRSQTYESLSLTLQQLGRTQEAAAVCHWAEERGVDSSVLRYLIASFTGNATPSTAPASYVTRLFEQYAPTFDQHLVQALQYHVPERVRDVVLRLAENSRPASPSPLLGDVLDLGCGTGLCGPLLKPHARTLRGVDLSPDMIEKAKQRNVYDELVVADITTDLSRRTNACDLIVATDVFVYVGALEAVFAGVAAALRPRGLFAFSVEAHEPDGYALRPSLRFAHSAPYLRNLAATHHFTEESWESDPLRLDGPKPVAGYIAVLRKTA